MSRIEPAAESMRPSERRGRWGRASSTLAQSPSFEETRPETPGIPVSEKPRADRRWAAGVVPTSSVVGCETSKGANASARPLYTLGTWRVSREMYLQQLSQLGVKQLIDVRGNPSAGREETLHRGKDFTRALASVGVRYEHWGDKLGEDHMENGDDQLRRVLKGMLAAAPAGPLCIFGHLHEPHKCHRLRVCNLLPPGCRVQHLMWEDHSSIRILEHAEAQHKHDTANEYFYAKQREEKEKRRKQLSSIYPLSQAALSVDPTKLKVLVWENTPPSEWEERLRDGSPYRLLLPWDTELLWYPRFLNDVEADELEHTVHDRITMYHPTYRFQTPSGLVKETVNRKGQAKVCDDFTFSVQYSSRQDTKKLYNVDRLEDWSRSLLHRVERASETVFNAIWFNHYRDGTVTIHWHTDSDEGLGPNALIGSVSLGATREFCFKSKRAWAGRRGAAGIIHMSLPLFHGSLVVMGRNSQTHWLHAVPAMEGVNRDRTNLTFRFYAHEDLAIVDGKAEDHESAAQTSQICLQNSKLLREPTAVAKSADRAVESQRQRSLPARFRLIPDMDAWRKTGITSRPFLIDAPSDPHTTVNDLCQIVCEQLFPDHIKHIRLGVSVAGDIPLAMLDDSRSIIMELTRCGAKLDVDVVDLVVLPPTQTAKPQHLKPENPCLPLEKQIARSQDASRCAWLGMLACSDLADAGTLRRELEIAPPGEYVSPRDSDAMVASPAEGDWIREVLQNLSGIQRKSKGKGQVSHVIYHQCSEFVALYAGRPKSTVHLLVSPKRLVQRSELDSACAPMVSRLALYSSFLACHLSAEYPGLLFAAGLRSRRGRVHQFHGHLISMDLAAPRSEYLERRHFKDFAGGSSHFLSLEEVACRLATDTKLPSSVSELVDTKELICHRCGQRFGDAMRALAQHLLRCVDWPRPAGGKSARCSADDHGVAELEEMGFGVCGREALRAALLAAGGSIEGAVAQLVR